jgi:molybdopterin-guanine dinucleotide biosynthesis protein A
MLVEASAAILAGGRARRFAGRDKSRLIVEGDSIIHRQVEVLHRVAKTVFIISSNAERFADLSLPVFPDAVTGAGAIGGIYTALEVSTHEHVLVVACDLPFLDAALLFRLVELTADADAAWVRSDRGPEPMLACYRRAAARAIRREIDAGRLKASDLGSALRVAELPVSELARFGEPSRLLANINTSDDYERITGSGKG